jgi:hypothetical protein
VAAVYRTPLPAVMDMPLCSILAYLAHLPVLLPMLEPLMEPPTRPSTPDELRALARKAGMQVVPRA